MGYSLALLSSFLFGLGDIFGGIACRVNRPFTVVALASGVGSIVMAGLALASGERFPHYHCILWAMGAGTSGAFGAVALYRGISLKKSAIVSPTSAVICAVLPSVIGSMILGLPSLLQIIGLLTACTGIWLLTIRKRTIVSWAGLKLGIGAGVGFALFFVFVSQVQKGYLFGPLSFAKLIAAVITGVFAVVREKPRRELQRKPAIVMTGVLDPVANALYVGAAYFIRMDLAVILVALYPAITVALSKVFFKEKISKTQFVGIILCLIAVALVTSA